MSNHTILVRDNFGKEFLDRLSKFGKAFQSNDIDLSHNLEAQVAFSLLLLMKKHIKTADIKGQISPLLYSSLPKIQDVLYGFEPTIGHVDFPDLVQFEPINSEDR